ncbi:MAG: ribonuclease E, partial [Rhodobacterales bacterium CG18_big_fil_WC_8_21_14_2_50_71_9]
MRRVATLLLCLALAAPGLAAPVYPGAAPFAADGLEMRRQETLRRLAAGDAAGAVTALRALVAASPRTGALHAALAVALAATGARE